MGEDCTGQKRDWSTPVRRLLCQDTSSSCKALSWRSQVGPVSLKALTVELWVSLKLVKLQLEFLKEMFVLECSIFERNMQRCKVNIVKSFPCFFLPLPNPLMGASELLWNAFVLGINSHQSGSCRLSYSLCWKSASTWEHIYRDTERHSASFTHVTMQTLPFRCHSKY